MQCLPIQTRVLMPPQDDMYEVFNESVPQLKEKDILLVTSKIVSIHQGRCIERSKADLSALVHKESKVIARRVKSPITITNYAIVLGAGIDPFKGHYILQPQNPNEIAHEIRRYFVRKYNIENLGIIISDSRSQPLRRGLMCYSLGHAGIRPLIDKSKFADYAHWASNAVDSLTAYAGLYLGESSQRHENTPIVLVRGADIMEFTGQATSENFFITGEDDFYSPLYFGADKSKT